MTSVLPRGAVLKSQNSIETKGLPHSETIPWQTRMGCPPNREVGQSSRAHRSQLTFCTLLLRLRPSPPPSAPNSPHSWRHCPDQDVAVRAEKDRLCRIRSAGAGTRTRFKPAPWKVREGRVAGQPSVQSACARECACKRWVGGRSLHHLGLEKGTSTADSPSHLSPEAGAYSLQARDRPGEPWPLPGCRPPLPSSLLLTQDPVEPTRADGAAAGPSLWRPPEPP